MTLIVVLVAITFATVPNTVVWDPEPACVRPPGADLEALAAASPPPGRMEAPAYA